MHWMVEVDLEYRSELGTFEEVEADSFDIMDGALVFWKDGGVVYIIAAGKWMTLSPKEET